MDKISEKNNNNRKEKEMIPYEIFGMFFVADLVFLWAAFMHVDTGFWESSVFSVVSVVLSFMLAFWIFGGVSVDGVAWSNAYAAMFFGAIALLCLANFIVRTLDGFGKNIDVSRMLNRWL